MKSSSSSTTTSTQRLHLSASDLKASNVKSDLVDFKNNLNDMKSSLPSGSYGMRELHELRSSLENLVSERGWGVVTVVEARPPTNGLLSSVATRGPAPESRLAPHHAPNRHAGAGNTCVRLRAFDWLPLSNLTGNCDTQVPALLCLSLTTRLLSGRVLFAQVDAPDAEGSDVQPLVTYPDDSRAPSEVGSPQPSNALGLFEQKTTNRKRTKVGWQPCCRFDCCVVAAGGERWRDCREGECQRGRVQAAAGR